MLQTDPKEAVKGIYKIQNSVCAKDSFVCARDGCIVCKEHIHDNLVIDLSTSNCLVNTKYIYMLKADPIVAVESIYPII